LYINDRRTDTISLSLRFPSISTYCRLAGEEHVGLHSISWCTLRSPLLFIRVLLSTGKYTTSVFLQDDKNNSE